MKRLIIAVWGTFVGFLLTEQEMIERNGTDFHSAQHTQSLPYLHALCLVYKATKRSQGFLPAFLPSKIDTRESMILFYNRFMPQRSWAKWARIGPTGGILRLIE